jgi:hypothetical protein
MRKLLNLSRWGSAKSRLSGDLREILGSYYRSGKWKNHSMKTRGDNTMKKILIITVLFLMIFTVSTFAGLYNRSTGTCIVDGCDRTTYAHSYYCSSHKCSVSYCKNKRTSNSQYCYSHKYKEKKKTSGGSSCRSSYRSKSKSSSKSSFDPDDHDIESYYDDYRDEYDDYDDAYDGFCDDEDAWDDY